MSKQRIGADDNLGYENAEKVFRMREAFNKLVEAVIFEKYVASLESRVFCAIWSQTQN